MIRIRITKPINPFYFGFLNENHFFWDIVITIDTYENISSKNYECISVIIKKDSKINFMQKVLKS